MIFRAREFEFHFPRPALVMGVVNVTPDSFSDGGLCANFEAAITHALKLAEQGADILDIGGESTRPRSTPVSAEEELSRVIPVIKKIKAQVSIPISIDTMKPEVARAAIEAGASIVNDVAANRANEKMWQIVAQSSAGYVMMHMQGTPETMQQNPTYTDVVAEVNEFFKERLSKILDVGVKAEQIVLDVGIGFGKTLEHNLQLLGELRGFTKWKRPLLLGASRKSFIERLLGAKVTERLPASLACACWAAQSGVQIIRTHDVAETKQAVRMTEAILEKIKVK